MTLKSRSLVLSLAFLMAGCAGSNPFVSARFAGGGLAGSGAGGGNPGSGSGRIRTTCDLPGARKSFFVRLDNAANARVSYRITMLASAGTGGFVCDDDLDDYLNAGYRALALDPATQTATIGCDPVRLNSGTQLLALTLTGDIARDATGGANPQLAAAPLNGAVPIPIPQLIVLGNNDLDFICQGNDPCSQGGFTYRNDFGILISKVTASRTQNTLCNSRVATRPEWLLLDPNEIDTDVSAFHYTTGCFITIRVLNRADNSDPNVNQVVWQVISADGTILHDFQF